jgi:hypothetical protein
MGKPAFLSIENSVARWYIFKPKITIWVNFVGMDNVGIFYGHAGYITALWDILWQFGNIHRVNLVYFPRLGVVYI